MPKKANVQCKNDRILILSFINYFAWEFSSEVFVFHFGPAFPGSAFLSVPVCEGNLLHSNWV